MSKDGTELLERVLALPERERAAFAERLLESLDGPPDPDADAAWQDEIARRLDEIDSGAVKLIPWESIREEIRNLPRAES